MGPDPESQNSHARPSALGPLSLRSFGPKAELTLCQLPGNSSSFQGRLPTQSLSCVLEVTMGCLDLWLLILCVTLDTDC